MVFAVVMVVFAVVVVLLALVILPAVIISGSELGLSEHGGGEGEKEAQSR
jgi:hypothetical protein